MIPTNAESMWGKPSLLIIPSPAEEHQATDASIGHLATIIDFIGCLESKPEAAPKVVTMSLIPWPGVASW